MKETIGVALLILAVGLFLSYFVFRPLAAIGDIPDEIRQLRESVDNLSKIIKNKYEQDAEYARKHSTKEGAE